MSLLTELFKKTWKQIFFLKFYVKLIIEISCPNGLYLCKMSMATVAKESY